MLLIVFRLVITILRGDVFMGLWTVIIGLFLFAEAKEIIRKTSGMQQTLVAEVMSLPFSVSPDENILHFVDRVSPLRRQTVFPVAQHRQLDGVLTLEDLKKVERERWHKTKIQDVMRPITTDYFVETTAFLTDVRVLMRENGIGALGVIDETGQLVGFLERGRIRRTKG